MLVVGLGNPGARYSGSPHNVGFRVLDSLAARLGSGPDGSPAGAAAARVDWSERFQAEFLLTQVDAEELVLLKPLTFMNRSGTSVRQAMSFFEIAPSDTLIVHDEIDLPFGAVKLKRGGGEAGHHGLESVTAEVGSREYARLRVGVGKPAAGAVADFLLEPLPVDRQAELGKAVELAGDAIELVARQGVDRAMNEINRTTPNGGGRGNEAGRPD